jgi:hypothetical protein
MSRFFSINAEAPPFLSAAELYERKPVTDLWNRLSVVAKQQWKWRAVPNKNSRAFLSSQRRVLQVSGPPGTGKSSATYYWVHAFCKRVGPNHPVQVLWINCAVDATRCWRISHDAGLGRVMATPMDLPTSSEDATCADIVVLDGL